jgi:hypothetical protein
MGMADADVQMASRLASAVALTAPPGLNTATSGLTAASSRAASARVSVQGAEHAVSGAGFAEQRASPTGSSLGQMAGPGEQQQQQQQEEEDWAAQQQEPLQQGPQQQRQPQLQQAYGSDPTVPASPVAVLDVEHHSRPQQDYYSLTALLDFTSFIYLALFYQVVMSSARSLADLTDEKQLPWDYLTALLLLFVIMVVDRLVYSLGSQLGKALLLLGQLLLFIPFCMSLFWSPAAPSSSSRAREHIRVFLVLKAASWVSSALQLRSGFPPRASFTGGGRQMFVFYSKADVWHLMGYYIFQVRHRAGYRAGFSFAANLESCSLH